MDIFQREKGNGMINENEIICGHCGNKGYIEYGFHVDWAIDVASKLPLGEIVCDECGASILFNPLDRSDIDNIVYHTCDDDWGCCEDAD